MASRKVPLLDHSYTASMVHPLTGSVDRYILGDRFHDSEKRSGHKKATCKYHRMDLCPELTSFQSVTSEVLNSKIKSTRLQSSNQQNLVHYFIYNRLMDYWSNCDIVTRQQSKMLKAARDGETVVRDEFHRLVYVCTGCLQQGHTAVSCAN